MSTVVIRPRPLSGIVTPPPSKSQAHRLLLCAALARGESTIENAAFSEDIRATLRCVEALGARWSQPEPGTIQVTGTGGQPQSTGEELPRFDCGESGSTLRFLIPVALAAAGGGIFTGRGRLMERPQQPYFDLFREKGIFYEQKDGVLKVKGQLEPGEFAIPGNVSSQFLTGLLLALPLLPGESTVRLTTPLESRDYVCMTLEALGDAGIAVTKEGDRFRVPGGQSYQPGRWQVEADWSQAAFWYAANFLGSQVELRGLNPRSAQGDMRVASDYWRLARPGDTELDVSQCPDLVPPLAAMAAVRRGTARLTHAARLRMKESDRLTTVAAALNALGGQVEEGPDSLTIRGLDQLAGGTVDCCNDHRIAMMAAAAAVACRGPVTLVGAECVSKSYPDFWEHYRELGGDMDVLISG